MSQKIFVTTWWKRFFSDFEGMAGTLPISDKIWEVTPPNTLPQVRLYILYLSFQCLLASVTFFCSSVMQLHWLLAILSVTAMGASGCFYFVELRSKGNVATRGRSRSYQRLTRSEGWGQGRHKSSEALMLFSVWAPSAKFFITKFGGKIGPLFIVGDKILTIFYWRSHILTIFLALEAKFWPFLTAGDKILTGDWSRAPSESLRPGPWCKCIICII